MRIDQARPAPAVAEKSSRRRPWLGICFYITLTLWTVALLAPIPQKAASQVLGGATGMFWFGKALHVGAYAFLTVFAGLIAGSRQRYALLLVALLLHGGVTEFIQQFVGRGGSWRDWGLDCCGILLGVVLGWCSWIRRFRRERDEP